MKDLDRQLDRPNIVCVGECLIDFTPIQRQGRTAGFELHPGGSPYNVAVGVGRIGHPSAFAGRVSTDLFGRLLVQHLEESGVDTSLLHPAPEPTTLAFVAFDGDEAMYSFRTEGTADTLIRASDLRPVDFGAAEVLHFGAISLLFEPTSSSILGLVRALRGQVALSFDPNIRPNLVRDWPSYRKLLSDLVGLTDLLKISETDLRGWGEIRLQDLLASKSSDDGPVAVVLTRGGVGSRLYTRGLALDCPPAPCRPVDTVGAGDAYTAGLLVSLAESGRLTRSGLAELDADGWLEAMRFASATSALTCEQAGANPPRRAEVLRRLQEW